MKKINWDSIGLIVIALGSAVLYSGFEFITKTYDIQTVIVIITIILYSVVTQLLMIKAKRSENALRKMNETLEIQVAERTSEFQKANMQLQEEISIRRTAEENLRKSEHKYRTIFENTGTATIIADQDTTIILANTEFGHLTGYTRQQLEGRKSWLEFIETSDMEKMLRVAHAPKSDSDRILKNYECCLVDKVGITKSVLITFAPISESDKNVISVSDVSRLKEAEKQIYHQAFHDALTNLPNRLLFTDYLNMEIKRRKRLGNYHFAVVYLDIDRFKNVNDSLGHLIGDKLLIAFTIRLKACLREVDIMARFGGDEFVILLVDIDSPDSAQSIIRRIRKSLEKPFELDNHEVFTSASFGMVLNTHEYESAEEIIRDADAAMYEAKETGRSRLVIFDKILHEKAIRVLQLETDLRKAVEKNEFELYYQPIVSIDTVAVSGFEALIRWNHPRLGIVYPDSFISVAEETGMIIPIGRWVLEEACTQLREWHKFSENNTLSMSVNI